MNTICLYIKVNNEYNNYLHKIFKGIKFTNYRWDVHFCDIVSENSELLQMFEKNSLYSQDIETVLNYTNYYVIELDFKGYEKGACSSDVKTVDDFLDSECIFLFLLFDCTHIHFYCKNTDIIEVVYKNCKDTGLNVERKNLSEVINNVVSSWQ